MRQTGTGVSSTIGYRTLQCHSMFQVDHLVIRPTPLFSMDMVMDTGPTREDGFLSHSSKNPAAKESGSRFNGTPQWITVPVLFPEDTRR